jgi:hypothetical protein
MDQTSNIKKIFKSISLERALNEDKRILDEGEESISVTIGFGFELLDCPIINAYYYIKSCKMSKRLQKITLVCNTEMLV